MSFAEMHGMAMPMDGILWLSWPKRMDVTKVLTLIVPSNKAKSLEETPCLQKDYEVFWDPSSMSSGA